MSIALPVMAALWLGILTAISPCHVATNIVAISYISRKANQPRYTLISGLVYALGRVITYTLLGMLIVNGLLAIPAVSHFLRHYMHLALGPLLVLIGMYLVGLLSFGVHEGTQMSEAVQLRIDRTGIWGALLLGVLFSLSFCPTSAALFFGSLVSLAVEQRSAVILPLAFGLGTALPVAIFAVLLARGVSYAAQAFDAVKRMEHWARRVTGAIFIAAGIYFTWVYILR